jgi:DNA-binding NtrC family response regulator
MTSTASTGPAQPLGRVLVIDDEFHVGAFLRDVLVAIGYTVEYADAAAQAFELLNGYQPDVAIVDLKMPGMSGIEVLEHLRRIRPRLPVIIVSGNHDADLMRQAVQKLGAFDFLQKPFDIASLERVLAAAISSTSRSHDCGCSICTRALRMIRSIVAPSHEVPEAFLIRLDTEATAILREAGEDTSGGP